MKELSIEEKAKRYDKTINAIKELKEKHPTAHVIKDWINENFPELRESDDEKIRKHLISFFDDLVVKGCAHVCENTNIKVDDILSWLEKQKPVEWDKEDEVIKEDAVFFINEYKKSNMCKNEGNFQNAVTCEDWLKSLQPQKRHVYITEEELSIAKKDAYNEALDKIEYGSDEPTFDDGWSAALLFLRKKNIYF